MSRSQIRIPHCSGFDKGSLRIARRSVDEYLHSNN